MKSVFSPTQLSQAGSAPTWLVVVLTIVAIGSAAAGVFYWQRTDKLELTAQNQQLQAQLQSTAATPPSKSSPQTLGAQQPSSPTISSQILTGQVEQDPSNTDMAVICYVLTGSIDTLWLRYGNTLEPQQRTQAVTDDFSQGDPQVFSPQRVLLSDSTIDPGTLLSYQCVGSLSGQEFAGGIATFMRRQ